jgi:protein-tyrosine phosphatase
MGDVFWATCSHYLHENLQTHSLLQLTLTRMMDYQPACTATTTTNSPPSMRATVSTILPGKLYLSGITAATTERTLSAYKITHVLSILSPAETIQLPANFNHRTIPLSDTSTAPLLAHIPAAVEFISTALGQDEDACVLVHCVEGISRSASAVISYLMFARGMEFRQALRIVKHRRSIVCPNLGFVRQLSQWGVICEARTQEKEWEKVLRHGRLAEVDAEVADIKAEAENDSHDGHSGTKRGGECRHKNLGSVLAEWIYGMSRVFRGKMF